MGSGSGVAFCNFCILTKANALDFSSRFCLLVSPIVSKVISSNMSEESARAQLKISNFSPLSRRQMVLYRVFYTSGTDYSAKVNDPLGRFIHVRHHIKTSIIPSSPIIVEYREYQSTRAREYVP